MHCKLPTDGHRSRVKPSVTHVSSSGPHAAMHIHHHDLGHYSLLAEGADSLSSYVCLVDDVFNASGAQHLAHTSLRMRLTARKCSDTTTATPTLRTHSIGSSSTVAVHCVSHHHASGEHGAVRHVGGDQAPTGSKAGVHYTVTVPAGRNGVMHHNLMTFRQGDGNSSPCFH